MPSSMSSAVARVEGEPPVCRQSVPLDVRQFRLAGSHGAAGQGFGAEGFWPTARWLAELAGQEPDDRVRYVEAAGFPGELSRVCPYGDQVQRQITDHLRRRGDLDDVAEDVVGGGDMSSI
jgi:hypothetical protein